MNPDQEKELARNAALGIAVLRAWCGAWLLLTAALKLPFWGPEWDFPARFARWLELAASSGAHPAFRSLLNQLVPHATGVIWAAALVEIALGSMLVAGFWTRTACAGTILLYVNYWFATARLGYATVAPTVTIALTAACLWIGNAGMFYGVDGRRARRKPTTLAPPLGARSWEPR